MEKGMLVLAKFKSGDGMFEKFMGWMQSDQGMGVRKSVAHVEKTVPAVAPDKSYIMFKLSVHNEEGLKELASGNNPIAKPTWDECIESMQVWELSSVNILGFPFKYPPNLCIALGYKLTASKSCNLPLI